MAKGDGDHQKQGWGKRGRWGNTQAARDRQRQERWGVVRETGRWRKGEKVMGRDRDAENQR